MRIVMGVTGGIAAYKACEVVSRLKKLGYEVDVIMTENATRLVAPLTFETLSKRPVCVDTFTRTESWDVKHISLAQKADLFLVAPATANVCAKLAHGLADDMLTTTVMASTAPKIISPAMNHNMYHNPIVQDNISRLENYGYTIIPATHGMLANGDDGDGRMPDEKILLEYVIRSLYKKDLSGKKILVTAGATQEALDPVRYITNHSTGKMGYSVAQEAVRRGADVILVSGRTNLDVPEGVKFVPVVSAKDMYNAVMEKFPECDIVVKSAAVADYTPETVSSQKIKKHDGNLSVAMKRTDDIIAELGRIKKPEQFICGFSMETENMLENSRKKLISKNIDMICANSLNQKGAGFGTDTNIVTIITKSGEKQLELMDKSEVAGKILDSIISCYNK